MIRIRYPNNQRGRPTAKGFISLRCIVVLLLVGLVAVALSFTSSLLNDPPPSNLLKPAREQARTNLPKEEVQEKHATAPPKLVHTLDPLQLQEAKRIQRQFCADLMAGEKNETALDKTEQPLTATIEAGLAALGAPSFVMHIRDKDSVSSYIRTHGSWKPQILQEIARRLRFFHRHELHSTRRDITFVDIGANIGWFTLNIAALGYNVIAFEPMESNLRLLRTSICANPAFQDRITLFGHGLSNQTQRCFLYSSLSNVGNGITQCNPEHVSNVALPGSHHEVHQDKVLLKPLDHVIQTVPNPPSSTLLLPESTRPLNIGAVKIDAEGFEPLIWKGGSQFLNAQSIPFIFCDFAVHRLRDANHDFNTKRYLDLYYNAGFEVQKMGQETTYTRHEAFEAKWPYETDITLIHNSTREKWINSKRENPN